MEFLIDHVETPIGTMRILCDAEGNLRATDWDDHADRWRRLLTLHYGEMKPRAVADPFGIATVMKRYFAGEIGAIDALRTATNGTAFQRDVWAELRRIPGGTTISYGQLAVRIGRQKAVRAVGLANGSNPIGIVVPCHRVIGSNGKLTGYGGGLERKEWLLRHEAEWASPLFRGGVVCKVREAEIDSGPDVMRRGHDVDIE